MQGPHYRQGSICGPEAEKLLPQAEKESHSESHTHITDIVTPMQFSVTVLD